MKITNQNTILRPAGLLLFALSAGCWSTQQYKDDADEQVYDILGKVSKAVTGESKVFPIESETITLRQRLLESDEPVVLDLKTALDVAAENSRAFQNQKESLYQSALSLTSAIHNFDLQYTGGGSADIDGVDDDSAQASFRDDLSASLSTESGGRLVASFATTWLRDLLTSDSFNGNSSFNLSFTQPLINGFGTRIARESLTQAERSMVYAMRRFEHARSEQALSIVQSYYSILERVNNLADEEANYEALEENTRRTEAMVAADRDKQEGLDQARQELLDAENGVIDTRDELQGTLDNFKITLGLPTIADVTLDQSEFDKLSDVVEISDQLDEENLVAYAFKYRYDYQTLLDELEDTARRVMLAEDELGSALDFSSAIALNSEPGKPFKFTGNNISWAAGFDLDLALDELSERNAYRSALIAFDQALRGKDEFEDSLRANMRQTIRNVRNQEDSFRIQKLSVATAERRVLRTELEREAGREGILQRDVLDAKRALLNSQLRLTGVQVAFAIAKLQLLLDLEALPIEPKGLRYDPGIPIPDEALYGVATPEQGSEESRR